MVSPSLVTHQTSAQSKGGWEADEEALERVMKNSAPSMLVRITHHWDE
jgi:hypothetical protein